MKFDVFLNFDGNCREALAFYSEIFGQPMPEIMPYEDNPQRVLYASLPIYGNNIMFSDCGEGFAHVIGNNFALTLNNPDEPTLTKLFNNLANGGTIIMPMSPTFFSEYFGMVVDRFGITWQLIK